MPSTSTAIKPKVRRFDAPQYSARYIVGYSHYLVMKAQLAGNLVLDGHKPSAEEQNIAVKIRDFCDVIDRQLSLCREDDIADLLECYDLTYRIGYQRIPDKDRLNQHKHRLVRAWKSSNRYIQESSVFGMISGDVRYRSGSVDCEFVDAYNTILKKWVTTLTLHSSFPDASAYETYQRLSLLMPLNLDSVLGNKVQEIKRRWYKANKEDNLSSLNSQILRSYLRFISSLPPEVMDFKKTMDLKGKVLRELSGRKDLEPHDAEAFQMALKFHTELMQA